MMGIADGMNLLTMREAPLLEKTIEHLYGHFASDQWMVRVVVATES
jgi:hypothetical protein